MKIERIPTFGGRYRLMIDGADTGQIRKTQGGWEAAGVVWQSKAAAEQRLINRYKLELKEKAE